MPAAWKAAFTRHPILEPAFLYGGYPFKDLRHKFLMAQESDVSDVSRLSEDQLLKDLELIPFPAFFQMIGIRTRMTPCSWPTVSAAAPPLEKYRVSLYLRCGSLSGNLG